ncbi:c-type cytochrome [Aureibaculum conchae]|uniref:c-type cytochrome n=1 Tax=Aureibaculum sp. 2308TA14-22 TaxID=3108392 RepID=UPI0033918DD5
MIKIIFPSILFFYFCFGYSQDKKSKEFVESIDRGAIIYEDFCMNCHLPDGKGVEKVTPPLAKSDYLMKNREKSIRAVKFGQSGEITVNGKIYNGTMTAMGLSNKEIADVMNYITNNFGNSNNKVFTEEEVLKIEK